MAPPRFPVEVTFCHQRLVTGCHHGPGARKWSVGARQVPATGDRRRRGRSDRSGRGRGRYAPRRIGRAGAGRRRLERRERRRVAGEACDVYRSAGAPSVDHFAPVPARWRTYTDWCLDGRGLVLERRTVENDRVTEELVATRVEPGVAVSADDLR